MTGVPNVRVLVVDDERPARRRLADLVARRDDVELVGACPDGIVALAGIEEHRPDVVLLDIQMPGMDGLDLVRELGSDAPQIVFITAHEEHALTAFDLAAVDYILKPFTDERFDESLDRAVERVRSAAVDPRLETLRHLLGSRDSRDTTASRPWPTRVAVERRGALELVELTEVTHITADGPYATLHVGDLQHLVRVRIKDLEQRLDPDRFWRIHRSTIVNVDFIGALRPTGSGDFAVRLKSGEELRLSRTYRESLGDRLGLL